MPIQVEDITVYNVKEISELLGITQVTIREYIRQGKLRAKKIAGEWRITGDALRFGDIIWRYVEWSTLKA